MTTGEENPPKVGFEWPTFGVGCGGGGKEMVMMMVVVVCVVHFLLDRQCPIVSRVG